MTSVLLQLLAGLQQGRKEEPDACDLLGMRCKKFPQAMPAGMEGIGI